MTYLSPVEAYRAACDVFFEVQSLDDVDERLKRMADLQARWVECFRALVAASSSADPEVWYTLGCAYNVGRGTKPNRKEAMRWFRRAAKAGHTRAMVSLGLCYRRAKSSAKDHATGVRWFRKAASLGETRGMVWLGFSYRDGLGVPLDSGEALKWFIKAVEAGNLSAISLVGSLFLSNLDLPRQAIEWFLRGAQTGCTQCCYMLAQLYDDPKMPVFDPAEAVKWHLALSKTKRSSAACGMLALARHYRDGSGVPRDMEKACYWLQRLLNNPASPAHICAQARKFLVEMRKGAP